MGLVMFLGPQLNSVSYHVSAKTVVECRIRNETRLVVEGGGEAEISEKKRNFL